MSPRHGATEEETGERRQLTVLFCDLVGSTELSARLDPEDWQAVLRTYQQRAGEVIARFGGYVAQYLGDGLLVYFGWPQTYDDAAERAVRAGLGLVDTAATVKADGTPLAVRVGLHTGAVVVGAVGESGRQETFAFGEAPNVAARVQAAAAPGTVLVTAATQRLVTGIFLVEERGPHTLKGIAGPVVLYRVVQPSGVRSRLDVAAGKLTPFIGRQTELATLLDAWERVLDGTGQTVLVQGEAGVGKSRLAYQLREGLAASPHTWLECRSSPYTAGTAFHPVIELVEQGVLLGPTDTPAEKLGKLAQALGWASLPTIETLPLLAEFLSLPAAAGYTPLDISPELRRRKILEALAAWTLRLGELQPVLLLLEDLHWCDPSSLELFGRLVAQSARARLLIVATARPEFQNPWAARSNLQMLTLGQLTKRQAREMVARLGSGPALPEAIVEQIVTQADGVPLHVEELTRMALESDLLTQRDGRYVLTGPLEALAIPVTLRDSLMARLDRLGAAKEVAQRAAVLGREFGYELLAATAGVDGPMLREGLARLVAAELLFVRGEPPAATYTFKHALVQEAAYESLLKRARQERHGRVVDVLLERFPERTAAEPEVVARHAEAAGRLDDAVTYYQHAGVQAQQRSAHEEAIGHLHKAIAALTTLPAGAPRDAWENNLQMALGASLVAVRGYAHEETGAAWRRALVLSDAQDDPKQLAAALLGAGNFDLTRGDLASALSQFERALAIAEPTLDDALLLTAHQNLGSVHCFAGRFRLSLEHHERALAIYDPARHRGLAFQFGTDQGAPAQAYVAWILWHLGRPAQAVVRAQEAVARARQLAHPFTLGFTLTFETVLHFLRRDTAAQREGADEVMALGRSHGFPLWLGLGRALHAATRVTAQEVTATAEVMAGLALAAETGNQAGAPLLLGLLAGAQQAASFHVEALSTIETALAVSAATGQALHDADLHRLKAELVLATGGVTTDVEALFHQALDIARRQESRSFELRAATSLARLWRGQGRRDEARALLAPVYAWFTEGFDTGDLVAAKVLLEELR